MESQKPTELEINSPNRLLATNCNSTMCKTCIFRTDGKQFKLSPERFTEIKLYLLTNATHVCHTTDKTCFGALEFQAAAFHAMGLIDQPTVPCYLNTVREVLKL